MKRMTLLALLALAAPLSFVGCGWNGFGPNDSDDGAAIVVPPPARPAEKATLAGKLLDAATGAPIAGAMEVSVYGPDMVYDANGDKLAYGGGAAGPITVTGGLFSLYVRPPTGTVWPLEFRVVAKGGDYITSSQVISIAEDQIPADGTAALIDVTLRLVSRAAPPADVPVAEAQVTAGASGTTAPLTVTAAPAQGTPAVGLGEAVVAIPASTIVRDSQGAALTGALDVTVAYNNNATLGSLETFPGGFFVGEDPTGAPNQGIFISGGFASVEVTDAAGNQAKTFSQPIDITISIPKATVNPETGLTVAAGDTIPIWSYDTGTGEWSVQRDPTTDLPLRGTLDATKKDADGNWLITFPTDHLSYFNLDWFRSGDQTCWNAVTHTVQGDQGLPLGFTFWVEGFGWARSWRFSGGAGLETTGTPKRPIKVAAFYQGQNVGEGSFPDLCSPRTLTVDVSPFVPHGLSAFVYDRCSNDHTKKTPATNRVVDLRDAQGAYLGNALTGANGKADLGKRLIGTYQVSVQGQSQQVALVVGGTSVDLFLDQVCEEVPVTGATGGTGGTGGANDQN